MRTRVSEVSDRLITRTQNELEGRLVGFMVDIGSRFGKSFLTVSAQYMDTFEIQIRHLGMVIMYKRNTAVYIYERVMELMTKFKVSLGQLHTIVATLCK